MIQRDYILRMIEQFFALVRRILKHRETQQYEKALEAIRGAYKAFLGCDEEFVDKHSANDLIAMARDGILQAEQLVMAAKLLLEQAETLEALEAEDEAARLRLKSLALYLEVDLGESPPSSMAAYFNDIERLTDKLETLPLDLAARLPRYFEKRGRYAAAEDSLFRAAEAAPAGHWVFEDGFAFYRRLDALSAEELSAGGLPPAEVREGRSEFEALAGAVSEPPA